MIQRKIALFLIFFCWLFCFLEKTFPQTSSFKVRVTEEVANIRQNPDIRSPIIAQVPQNTLLLGLKREGEWIFVTWTEEGNLKKQGYIHESLVALVEPEERAEEKKVEAKEEDKEQKAREEKSKETLLAKKEPEIKSSPVINKSGPKKSALRLNLAPGGEFVSLSPINESSSGLASLMADLLNSPQADSISSLRWLRAASLEFQIPLKDNFSVIGQFSGIHGEKKNSIFYKIEGFQPNLFIQSKILTFPIAFLLNYEIWSFLSLALGPEIIPIEFRYLYRLELAKTREEWSGKAKSWGYGLKGRISFTSWLSTKVGLYLEIGGRRAKIRDFEGKDTHLWPTGEKTEEEGKLYFFQVRTSPDHLRSLLFIRAKRPAEAGIQSVEEASLNLSGVTLRFGFSFRF
ncbi:MAG: hypothetical protein N3B16_09430 [Candidatus Aminicenantes bacterium]|nr:hypothetical protein [Candidatus Aminicenantes bacterium]